MSRLVSNHLTAHTLRLFGTASLHTSSGDMTSPDVNSKGSALPADPKIRKNKNWIFEISGDFEGFLGLVFEGLKA